MTIKKSTETRAWIGLDQSYSGFGIVIVTSQDTDKTLWKFPPKDSAGMRLGDIYVNLVRFFTELQDSFDEVHVAMEGYAMGRTFNREKLGELGGVVKLAHATVFGSDPLVVPPTVLKKFITGKGNAAKKDVVAAVQDRWDSSVKNDNIADAYGLAEYIKDQKPAIM